MKKIFVSEKYITSKRKNIIFQFIREVWLTFASTSSLDGLLSRVALCQTGMDPHIWNPKTLRTRTSPVCVCAVRPTPVVVVHTFGDPPLATIRHHNFLSNAYKMRVRRYPNNAYWIFWTMCVDKNEFKTKYILKHFKALTFNMNETKYHWLFKNLMELIGSCNVNKIWLQILTFSSISVFCGGKKKKIKFYYKPTTVQYMSIKLLHLHSFFLAIHKLIKTSELPFFCLSISQSEREQQTEQNGMNSWHLHVQKNHINKPNYLFVSYSRFL